MLFYYGIASGIIIFTSAIINLLGIIIGFISLYKRNYKSLWIAFICLCLTNITTLIADTCNIKITTSLNRFINIIEFALYSILFIAMLISFIKNKIKK